MSLVFAQARQATVSVSFCFFFVSVFFLFSFWFERFFCFFATYILSHHTFLSLFLASFNKEQLSSKQFSLFQSQFRNLLAQGDDFSKALANKVAEKAKAAQKIKLAEQDANEKIAKAESDAAKELAAANKKVEDTKK